ncbi:MAG: PorT family protein [Bacteroidales bacterium]|nr:PorT family protein [Bacteroidales bacterium]
MKKFALIILSLISINVSGQLQFIGIHGGLNLTNITSDATFNNRKFRPGIMIGLNYEYKFSAKYSVGADVLYSQQGFRDKMISTEVIMGNTIEESYAFKFYYDYVSVPLKFGYKISEKYNGFVKIGISPSLLLKAGTTLPVFDIDGNIIGSKTFDVKESVSKFDLGGLVELGAGYGLYDNLALFSSIIYRHSFTKFSNPDYFEGSNMRHYGFSLVIGLKYKLK